MGSFSLLSDVLLRVYRNATDFCVLILYTATLLYLLIQQVIFCGIFRIFLKMISCHLQTDRDNFTFSCLIAMARTSGTLLTRSGEIGHLVSFLIVEGKLSTSRHECRVCCGFVLYGLYYVQVCFFST